MSRRLNPSLADYVAIAISPVLLMLLVGSLSFFLLELLYLGQYEDRLRWILFWFTVAIVLISRIGIEQGASHAAMYGLLMAGAMSLAMFRFVQDPGPAIGLLAVIWWCTHKLTWDCTYIDDSLNASGEGLLQAAGLDASASASSTSPSVSGSATTDSQTSGEKSRKKKRRTAEPAWWERWLAGDSDRPRPHTPGLWVVYFSMAALPLFGLGQLRIPQTNPASRTYAFSLLMVYVASGIGLLLTTSFLGLRRYLRQRQLTMPARVTAAWLTVGCSLLAAILVFCLVLPRPDAQYSVDGVVDRASQELARASRWAFGKGSGGKGDGTGGGKLNVKPAPGEDGEIAGGGQAARQGGDKPGQVDRQKPPADNRPNHANQDGPKADRELAANNRRDGMAGERGGEQPGDRPSDGSGQTQVQQNPGQGQNQGQNPGQGQGNKGESKQGGDQPGGKEPGSAAGASQSGDPKGANTSSDPENTGRKNQPGDKGANNKGPNNKGPNQGKGDPRQNQRGDAEPDRNAKGPPPEQNPKRPKNPNQPEKDAAKKQDDPSRDKEQQPDQNKAAEKPPEKAGEQAARQPPPQQPPPKQPPTAQSPPWQWPAWAGLENLFRLLIWAAIIAAIAYALFRSGPGFLEFLRKLYADWLAFWSRWFGGRKAGEAAVADGQSGPAARSPVPFADFTNPFTGGGGRNSVKTIAYTFRALEAWANDAGLARRSDETPIEFADRLQRTVDKPPRELVEFVQLYSHVAYANLKPASDQLTSAERLWRWMTLTAGDQVVSSRAGED
jgi:hypothetical protein